MESNLSKRKHFLDELLITPEDVQSAVDFYDFFDIPMCQELKENIELFKKKPDVDTQNRIKFLLLRDANESFHDVFKDPMFAEIVNECKTASYEMGFDLHLDDILLKED